MNNRYGENCQDQSKKCGGRIGDTQIDVIQSQGALVKTCGTITGQYHFILYLLKYFSTTILYKRLFVIY